MWWFGRRKVQRAQQEAEARAADGLASGSVDSSMPMAAAARRITISSLARDGLLDTFLNRVLDEEVRRWQRP
jgi:hypothetical protein